MKLVLSLIFLTYSISATLAKDVDFSKAVIGIWSATYTGSDYQLYGETIYRANGTFYDHGQSCQNCKCTDIIYTGTYEVSGNILTYTIKTSSSDYIKPGYTDSDTIRSIDSEKMILVSKKGEKQVRLKVTKPKFIHE